jgi:hypothetical protein
LNARSSIESLLFESEKRLKELFKINNATVINVNHLTQSYEKLIYDEDNGLMIDAISKFKLISL